MLKQILEALNTKVEYNTTKNSSGYNVSITHKEDLIDINFIQYLEDDIDSLYEITFSRNNEVLTMDLHMNTFEIMGIIKNVIIDFINTHKPNAVFFSSSDDNSSRIKLYTRLADLISKKGYRTYRLDKDIQDKDIATFLIYKDDEVLKSIQDYYNDV